MKAFGLPFASARQTKAEVLFAVIGPNCNSLEPNEPQLLTIRGTNLPIRNSGCLFDWNLLKIPPEPSYVVANQCEWALLLK